MDTVWDFIKWWFDPGKDVWFFVLIPLGFGLVALTVIGVATVMGGAYRKARRLFG